MSEVSTYLYCRAELERLYDNTNDMNDYILEAFNKSKAFFERIMETKDWSGLSKDQFQAYYHLVLQYHGQLAGESVPSVGKVSSIRVKDKPCKTALDTAKELISNMDDFTDKSEKFKRLEKS